jgi:hypothetical protein
MSGFLLVAALLFFIAGVVLIARSRAPGRNDAVALWLGGIVLIVLALAALAALAGGAMRIIAASPPMP